MKRKIRMVILGLMCSILLFGCGQQIHMTVDWAFDVNSFPERCANADYIIVGKVSKKLGSSNEHGIIYTNYRVEVIENLKGELRQDKPIEIAKWGGATGIPRKAQLCENDVLPVVDGTYIFFITAQPDGSNLTSGPNSTLPLDDTAANTKFTTRRSPEFDNLSYEEKIQEIKDAIEMNLPAVMEPSISNDDVSK